MCALRVKFVQQSYNRRANERECGQHFVRHLAQSSLVVLCVGCRNALKVCVAVGAELLDNDCFGIGIALGKGQERGYKGRPLQRRGCQRISRHGAFIAVRVVVMV